jgi:hypothetical protein
LRHVIVGQVASEYLSGLKSSNLRGVNLIGFVCLILGAVRSNCFHFDCVGPAELDSMLDRSALRNFSIIAVQTTTEDLSAKSPTALELLRACSA